MNKQAFKCAYLTVLFVLTLSAVSIISYASDSVRAIKLAELNSMLEANKGKVVILNLWATWCPACRKEIPAFINLYNKYKSKGVEIIGVALDEDGLEVVPQFVRKWDINYPIYIGEDSIAMKYDLEAFPTIIFHGKDGKGVDKHVGYIPEQELEDIIIELLKS